MINAQISPLTLSVDSQDIIDDLIVYKERALNTHIVKSLPKFMLNTPKMKAQLAIRRHGVIMFPIRFGRARGWIRSDFGTGSRVWTI